MTLHVFKIGSPILDETYSGTASRLSQRIVSSETACHEDWCFVTVDVEKISLQWMTHEEIEEAIGEHRGRRSAVRRLEEQGCWVKS